MAIRVDHTVAPQISRDTDQKQPLFFPDLNVEGVSIATLDKATAGVISIPASTTESLSFGDVDVVRGIYLEVSGACNIRLNGGVEDIPMEPAPEAARAKLFLEGVVTAIQIENTDSSVVLTGVFAVWGDPTP